MEGAALHALYEYTDLMNLPVARAKIQGMGLGHSLHNVDMLCLKSYYLLESEREKEA